MNNREIKFERIRNFRDLGGLAAAGGRCVRRGSLFRSAALSSPSARDTALLAELGIARVFDLRTEGEVESDGIGEFCAVAERHCHRPLVAVTVSPLDPTIDWATVDLGGRYLDMLKEGGGVVAELARWLASADSKPTVIHCTAGKDRTGVVAAVLLSALGVPRADIVSDYTLSQKFLGDLLATRADALRSAGLEQSAINYLTTAPKERIERALDELDRRWGGGSGYLIAQGLEREQVQDLRQNLLVKQSS